MVPFVSGAPVLALQRAPRAACSHARLMDASAPPWLLQRSRGLLESITTFTVTVTLWRSATSGLGHPLKLRPEAIPLCRFRSLRRRWWRWLRQSLRCGSGSLWPPFDVTRFFSSSESVGSVLFTALSRFDATFFSTGGAGFLFLPGTLSRLFSSGAGSGSPLKARAGASLVSAFSSPRSRIISGSETVPPPRASSVPGCGY